MNNKPVLIRSLNNMEVSVINNLVSDFFTSTCPVIGPVAEKLYTLQAVVLPTHRKLFEKSRLHNYEECLSGSLAEFYITPAITCCGDVDYMFYFLEDRCQSRDDIEVNTVTGGRLLFYFDELICPGYVNMKHDRFYCRLGYTARDFKAGRRQWASSI